MKRETFRVTPEISLAADVMGNPENPPVILLHGGSQTRHSWGTALRKLAEAGFYAHSLDLRGHGESSWSPEGEYEPESHADDLAAVVKSIGRPVALVGASLGGAVSLFFTSRKPECVTALVLVDISPWMDPAGVDDIVAFMRDTVSGFDSVQEAADAVARYLPHRPRPKEQSGLLKNLRRRDDGRVYWHWDPKLIEMTQKRRSDFDQRFVAAAEKVTAPTMLLRAGRSELVTRESAEKFVKYFQNARIEEIKDAHHMIAGDRNDAFNAALIAFLERSIKSGAC